MSNFKIKKKKQEKLEYRDSTTLDKKHKEHSLNFKNEKDLLPEKVIMVEKLQNELELLIKDKTIYTDDELERKATILNQIENLSSDISLVKDNFKELDYYDKIEELYVELLQEFISSNTNIHEY